MVPQNGDVATAKLRNVDSDDCGCFAFAGLYGSDRAVARRICGSIGICTRSFVLLVFGEHHIHGDLRRLCVFQKRERKAMEQPVLQARILIKPIFDQKAGTCRLFL